ncbi:MAG: hypothetical protein H0T76_20245 [Nannocystis sp.]|nr:hypothetical protein [Nannocystis sp.]MBA3548820.1 hypothetical protein [Nannocystis sp.]
MKERATCGVIDAARAAVRAFEISTKETMDAMVKLRTAVDAFDATLAPFNATPVNENEALINKLAHQAAAWSDEEFATRVVQMLILDEGVVNKWQRTIEIMIEITRKRERLL